MLVWQKAPAVTLSIYRLTAVFLKSETFALTSQLHRASASIPANFVEGFRKRTTPDELRYDNTAQGAADECRYHLILANDLNYADTLPHQAAVEEVARLLQAYMNGLRRHTR